MIQKNSPVPHLGFGLGLRPIHYPYIFEHRPNVDWFEIISENFMDTGGMPMRNLERIRERYPIVMHGVALSIGTVDPLNSEYLQKLKALMKWVKPAWISDHLCWTGIAHRNTHDLLPVPYTEEALAHIIQRLKEVQDVLEMPIALENPSTYMEFKSSSMPEAEFIARMAEGANCRLLLDVNNVYVTCFNHRLDPKTYIDTLPLDKVAQIHLSGHSNKGTHIIDTHDDHVIDEVWTLYKYVVNRAGRVPNTMVEWDDQIPEFDVLNAELAKARAAAATAKNYGELPNLAGPNPALMSDMAQPLANEQARLQDAIILKNSNMPEAWVRDKPDFPPQAQLDVYINSYRYRLYDVVAEDYPVLEYYLGVDAFKALIGDFVNTIPSEHFNIARYATKLPAFLAERRPQDALAHEICQLETSLCQLGDAEETDALNEASLQNLTPEDFVQAALRPRAATQLLSFSYPVNDYYRDVMDEKKPSAPARQESWLALLRHDDALWRMELEQQEFRLLEMLFKGISIENALQIVQTEFQENEETLSANLSRWFARWMKHHLFTRIETQNLQDNVQPAKRKTAYVSV
ncbi:MAG: DUF692 family multinuclear iron-containing protein [Pseudomonadota bacterium]